MPPNVGARQGDLQGTPRQQDTSFPPTSTSLWLPPEAPQFPGVGGGGGPPQECVCLCHQAHRAHGSSPRTPWPQGTLCQLSLLSWPSFSSDQSCFAPAVQERQRRRRFPASCHQSWHRHGCCKGQAKEGWSALSEERLPAATSLLRPSLLQESLLPAPLL